MRRYLPRSTEEVLQWHEKFISPITLLIGFSLDAFIFRSVDLLVSNVILFLHLVIAATGIVLYHLIQSGALRGRLFLAVVPFIPSVIQFSFGALFSGFVILYSQSAAYATSWIFIALLALLMIGNERFRKLYARFEFQASIYFLVLVSFFVFFLPVLLLRIGTEIFLISQIVSVAIMLVLLRSFSLLAPRVLKDAQWSVLRSIAGVLVIFNVLYFTNAIPPIPLALKDAGVYHSLRREGDSYVLKAEPLEWYQKYLRYNTVVRKTPGETVYVYTAVFAPTKLNLTVLHEWEWYDPDSSAWIKSGTFGFPITGGRDGGYRGYSLKESMESGLWRVNVRTSTGKLIGRVSFEVQEVAVPVKTVEVRK